MSDAVPAGGNLFAAVPERLAQEQVLDLLATPGLRIERIVSTGHASPPGFWYDQDWDEWVVLLAGAAAVTFAGEAEPRQLEPGSYLHIPAHLRHRVESTSVAPPAVWLAVHWPPAR
ncbi:MAG: cupin domain-containing protein [Alphaproteobacteria bacterium]|nr:cupin domain-containing protein [Alphaproteobacteria bacterium]